MADREPTLEDVLALLTPENFARLTLEEREKVSRFLPIPPPVGLIDEEHVWQAKFVRDPSRFKLACCSRRCLAAGTMVATPRGAVPIESLRPGDEVYDENGSVTKVVNVFDQGVLPVATFSNNGRDYVTATLDHRFRMSHVAGRVKPKDVRLGDIYKGLRINRTETHAPMGPVNEPHAYAIGAFLGDGCRSNSPLSILLSGADEEVIAKCAALIGVRYKKLTGNNYTWSIGGTFHHYIAWMKGRYAHNKLIDWNVVKTWNRRSCLDFLAGLIDTDGSLTHGPDGPTLCISMQNKAVLDVAQWLFLSLWNVQMSLVEDKRPRYKNGAVWEVKIKHIYHVNRIISELAPFIQCERKKRQFPKEPNNFSPEALGGKVRDAGAAHCWDIEVANESHLFLLANGLVSHNSGKSVALALMMLADGWGHPGSNYLYAGITLDSAKKAIWKDTLKVLDAKLNLGLTFNEQNSTCTLPNGAVIYVIGLDATEQQRRKARGGKFRIAIIDEAQDFLSDLEDHVRSILMPAVSDEKGTIVLAGTPGQVPIGMFYRLSKDAEAENPRRWEVTDLDTGTEWTGFTWSALNNPYMAEQFASDMQRMLDVNPAIADTPQFQREWRGMWVTDDNRKVYRYAPVRNDYDGVLPKFATGEWHHAIGVDLGFNDATAVCVLAWHDHSRIVYVVDCDKRPGLDITEAANWIRSWAELYGNPYIVVDGANKQAVMEMRRRHGLPLIAADKRGKAEFIDLLNADFIQGYVKWSPSAREVLCDEAAHLSWDERAWKRKSGPKRVEDPRAEQHGLDAHLYGWRFVLAYLSEDEQPEVERGSIEWMKQEERDMLERAERRVLDAKQQNDDLWRYS